MKTIPCALMKPALLLLTASLLLWTSPTAAQQTPAKPGKRPIRADFDAALEVFNADPVKAIPAFERLVTTRWSELSAKGKHGAGTLLMFAHLAAKQPAKAHAVGVALHRNMPAAFLALSRLTRGRDHVGARVRNALDLIALRTERGRSVVYLHNASKRDLRLDLGQASYALTYRYTTRKARVALHTANDKRGLPGGILALPRGGGAFLHSPAANATLSANVPDLVTVLACEAKRRLRGWIHLGEGDYTQHLERLTLTARARWGGQGWSDVALVELNRSKAAPTPKATKTPGGKPAHARHAKIGQRWVFRLPGGVTLEKRVLGLEPGAVKIRSTVLVDGKPLRAPTTQLWRASGTTFDPKAPLERVVVSGKIFDCQVVRTADGARSWSVPVFPGVIKSVLKGRTTLELIEIRSE